jgi:hypothetical protein
MGDADGTGVEIGSSMWVDWPGGGMGFGFCRAGARRRAGYQRAKEANVDDRSRVLMATLSGAVIGGVWGWLYLTAAGRQVRDQIEPWLDDFMREMARVRGTVEKARSAAHEGLRSINEIADGGAQQGRWSA